MIDVAVAVAIGAKYPAKFTAVTRNPIQPLIDQIGAGPDTE